MPFDGEYKHKSNNIHLCASSYRLGNIDILNFFELKNLDKGHVIEKWDLPNLIANINMKKS